MNVILLKLLRGEEIKDLWTGHRRALSCKASVVADVADQIGELLLPLAVRTGDRLETRLENAWRTLKRARRTQRKKNLTSVTFLQGFIKSGSVIQLK